MRNDIQTTSLPRCESEIGSSGDFGVTPRLPNYAGLLVSEMHPAIEHTEALFASRSFARQISEQSG